MAYSTDPRYDTPLSGVYWQIKDLESGETVRSRSLWDIELSADPPGRRTGGAQSTGALDRPLLIVLTRVVRTATRRRHRTQRSSISVAEERQSAGRPRSTSSATNLALFLGILAGTLILRGSRASAFRLRPLRTLQGNIAGGSRRAGRAVARGRQFRTGSRSQRRSTNSSMRTRRTNGVCPERAADLGARPQDASR